MTIHTKPLFRFLTALGLIATLAACGNGGGDDKDSTPDSFTITPVTDAAVSTEVTSSAVTLAGFNQDVSISITGGSYSIAGGAFTTVAGTVSSGKSVAVKVTASSATNTPVEAVLTVGGVTGNFKVTTKPDVTPNTFSFTAATDVVPKSVNTSAAITVAGIDIAVPISVTGGEYSINDAAFTSTAGTISKNQTVKVRGTAASTTNANNNVELTIGGVKATYAITTLADTVAPTAQILFPPPVSMTEGTTILVRGSASDDYHAVVSVKVMVAGSSTEIEATTTDGFKNWQALVPLPGKLADVSELTDSILTVATEDSEGNKSNDVAHVAIRQGFAALWRFPDRSGETFRELPWAMVVDRFNGKNRLLMTDGADRILSIDLATAQRRDFATLDSQCKAKGISINSSNQHLYVACSSSQIYDFDLADSSKVQIYSSPLYQSVIGLTVNVINGVVKVNTSDEVGTIITSNQTVSNTSVLSDFSKSIPNALVPISHSLSGIVYDKDRNRYVVSDYSQQAIFSVDADTGERKVLSSNTVGSGALFTATNDVYLSGAAVDDVNHRLIVTEALSGKLFSVDLITGNRTLLSSTTIDPYNKLLESYMITIVSPNGYAFVSDPSLHGIYAVDLVTGHRVVFSDG